MDQKKNLRELTLTRDEIQSLLSSDGGRLTAEEEKAIRMRHGCSLDERADIHWMGEGNAGLEEELRCMEASVIRRAQLAAEETVIPQDSREKDAIIQALKSGKKNR